MFIRLQFNYILWISFDKTSGITEQQDLVLIKKQLTDLSVKASDLFYRVYQKNHSSNTLKRAVTFLEHAVSFGLKSIDFSGGNKWKKRVYGYIKSRETYSMQFPEPGTYNYYSIPQKGWMMGQIIVEPKPEEK